MSDDDDEPNSEFQNDENSHEEMYILSTLIDETDYSVTKCLYTTDERCKKKNIIQLLQNRELGIQPTLLSEARCRVTLSSLMHVKCVQSTNNTRRIENEPIDVYDTVYLGLSHDSNKLAILKQNELTDDGNYTGRQCVDHQLIIYDLSPLYLLKASFL
uniref:Uncharacterized protein n=1 Tax=Acrobeloides nanus TaxID=290746 RepID=A0A914DXL3_9BILA